MYGFSLEKKKNAFCSQKQLSDKFFRVVEIPEKKLSWEKNE